MIAFLRWITPFQYFSGRWLVWQFNFVAFCLLLALPTACQAELATPQSLSETSPIVTEAPVGTDVPDRPTITIAPTFTPNPPPQTPTQLPPLLQNVISNSDIREIWWSLDSKTIFFLTQFSGSFAYALESGRTTESDSQIPSIATPHPETLAQLPPHYRAHISPSGNRALYSTQSVILPTTTPDPGVEGGEIVVPRQDTEMWLWENGAPRLLGIVRQCWLEDSFWAPDEQRVVLVEFGIPMPGCYDPNGDEPQAWLIDLRQETMYPLFPEAEFPPLQVYGFSPNGEQLLYGFFSDLTGANLHLLNLSAFTSQSLDAPVYDVIQWLSDQEILVSFRRETNNLFYPVGILNLETLEIAELTPTLTDTYIGNVALAPNQQWLALTTGENWFLQDKLWLINVNLDERNPEEN